MKEKANYQPQFVCILLIVAGTLSPSNGVDDKSNKSPLELITTMLVVVSAGLIVYLIWKWIENYKLSLKAND